MHANTSLHGPAAAGMKGAGRLSRLLAGCRPGASAGRVAEGQAPSWLALASRSCPTCPVPRIPHTGAARCLHGSPLRAQISAAQASASQGTEVSDAAVAEAVKEILESEEPSQPVVDKAADIALREATQDEAAATGIVPPTPAQDMQLPDAGTPPSSSSSALSSQAMPASADQAAQAAAVGEAAGAAAAQQASSEAGEQEPDLMTSRNEVLQRWMTNWAAFNSKLVQHDYYETREHKLDSLSMCAPRSGPVAGIFSGRLAGMLGGNRAALGVC